MRVELPRRNLSGYSQPANEPVGVVFRLLNLRTEAQKAIVRAAFEDHAVLSGCQHFYEQDADRSFDEAIRSFLRLRSSRALHVVSCAVDRWARALAGFGSTENDEEYMRNFLYGLPSDLLELVRFLESEEGPAQGIQTEFSYELTVYDNVVSKGQYPSKLDWKGGSQYPLAA